MGRQVALRWCAVPATASCADLAVLDGRERDRAAAIPHAAVRVRHVTAWALLRRLLAQLEGGDPADLWLSVDPDGAPTTGSGTSVSLAHTRDLVVVAACLDGAIGVDVERRDRQPLPPPTRWCSAAEVATWSALPTAARHRWQIRTWTAREATFKARAGSCAVEGPSTRITWFDPTGAHVVAVAR